MRQPTGSAYFMDDTHEPRSSHTAVLVDNEPGVLARVIGLFLRPGLQYRPQPHRLRGEPTRATSRITVVTTGPDDVVDQIKTQLDRLVPVHKVLDLTQTGRALERELMLIKVRGKGEARVEALNLADAFRARVIDATTESFVFEITGKPDKLDQFIVLMTPLGLVEVARTGVAAIARGPEGIG
ncbi:acetolactate synthase small subunit [Chenggangzhangella methanolivorans]|uniref:acetolactate synthase small subunit n=1 Tax=Chenggangzhangella methanolivorans TaxID=1437009 RepID=UPI0021BD02A8|nr:acetolactate synthase small subunit [Chenggangzhangella methanolivorans]